MAGLFIELCIVDRKTRRTWSAIWIMCVSESSNLCCSFTVGWFTTKANLHPADWMRRVAVGVTCYYIEVIMSTTVLSGQNWRVLLVLPHCAWTAAGKPKSLQSLENILGELGSHGLLSDRWFPLQLVVTPWLVFLSVILEVLLVSQMISISWILPEVTNGNSSSFQGSGWIA